MKPIIFDLLSDEDVTRYKKFKKEHAKIREVKSDDIFVELAKIRNPHISKNDEHKRIAAELKKSIGYQVAVYLPWKEELWSIPSRKTFFELTTARNRNLISPEEQHLLRKTVVGFWGMSVGSHVALSWMMEARPDVIKIADPDIVDATNLNRLRFGWGNLYRLKTDVVCELAYEMNPFAYIMAFGGDSKSENNTMFDGAPPVSIVIDEIDSIKEKILLRSYARERRLPVISAADVGDAVVLDIERYDIDPATPFFLGRISEKELQNIDNFSKKEKIQMIIKLVGFEGYTEKMVHTIMGIGGSVVTWPQLGATATIAGGIITTVIKKIILGEKAESGRYVLSPDMLLDSNLDPTVLDEKIFDLEYLLKKY